MIGWAVKMLAIWGGVGLLVYAFVGHRLVAPLEGTGAVASAPASSRAPASERPRSASPNTLVYRADKSGHVFLDGVVNGSPARFMLDTGATMVALTIQDAAAAGISRGTLNFTQTVSTANGTARVAPVKLREVRIGQFSAIDVPAAVVENLQMSLLGQTFLKRLSSYEMRDGVLTMYWN